MKTTVTATDARTRLYRLIEETGRSHHPITITGKVNNAVLVSEEDWNAIQETLYLRSIPGVRDSIVDGMKVEMKDCVTDLKW